MIAESILTGLPDPALLAKAVIDAKLRSDCVGLFHTLNDNGEPVMRDPLLATIEPAAPAEQLTAAAVDVESWAKMPPAIVYSGGDVHIGQKLTRRLGDAGIAVLLVGTDGGEYARQAARAVLAHADICVAVETEQDDPCARPINQPWYNDLSPGGKKSHRAKRNRSGNHW